MGTKYGNAPYIAHLDPAARVFRYFYVQYELNDIDYEDVLTAIYLHDCIEDTYITRDDILAVFNLRVANLVDAVTDRPGKNRRERHKLTLPGIRTSGVLAIIIKLADRIANIEASIGSDLSKLKMYLKEYQEFRKALYYKEAVGAPGAMTLRLMWNYLDMKMEYADNKE